LYLVSLLTSPLGIRAQVAKNIGVCHRTDAHQNPYGPKKIYVDDSSIFKKQGHDSHTGPIWFAGIEEKWGDIIEPFYYGGEDNQEYYPGLNWTERGQEIWNNNCQILELPSIKYCIWDESLEADDPRCVPCELDETLLADDPRCVPCELDETLLADDSRCVPCELDETILADDPRCVVCEWDSTLLSDDPECVQPEEPENPEKPEIPEEPGDEEENGDEGDTLGASTGPEGVGVVLAETGATSNILVYVTQAILTLSTIFSGIFFSKKYIM